MDDLAPAPAQRTSDEGGPRPEDLFSPRRKVPKKAPPVPAKDPEADPKSEPDHALDVLA